MKIPKNLTEEETLETINYIISKIAPKYTFHGFELDDLNMKIAGVPYQYNPAHPDCEGATHLGVGSFGNNLA